MPATPEAPLAMLAGTEAEPRLPCSAQPGCPLPRLSPRAAKCQQACGCPSGTTLWHSCIFWFILQAMNLQLLCLLSRRGCLRLWSPAVHKDLIHRKFILGSHKASDLQETAGSSVWSLKYLWYHHSFHYHRPTKRGVRKGEQYPL